MLDYTPRQADTFARLAVSRIKRQMADMLSISAMGARGKPEAVDRMLRELRDD